MNNNKEYNLYATAAFGLEGIVGAELKRLKMQNVRAELGGARFTGTLTDAFLCQSALAQCRPRAHRAGGGRMQDVRGAVPAGQVHRLGGHHARRRENQRVRQVRPQSIDERPRLSAITKKAIIERLKAATHRAVFPETGAVYPIDVAIHSDRVRITLDTSGEALNRRGYRTWNGEAPLRETLAASLVELSPWRPGMRLYDPCCGTGTLLIEAAFRQEHRAPGLTRAFAMEQFSIFPAEECRQIRETCKADVLPDHVFGIAGSDKDPEALELARRHVRQAGLEGKIELTCQPLEKLKLEGEPGVFLCNPPYGERLEDRRTCEGIYRELGRMMRRHPGWSLCAITSDPTFERSFGRRADKKRRLYNGRLECEFMTFLDPKSAKRK